MADPTGVAGLSDDELRVIVPLAAALLGPIVGAAASVVARFGLQSKISQIEYQLKRLDLLEKALSFEDTLGAKVPISSNAEILVAEYQEIVAVIAATRASEAAKAAVPAQRRTGIRALILPRPLSIAGWFASGIYYVYGFTALASLVAAIASSFSSDFNQETALTYVGNAGGGLLLAWGGWYWAVRNWRKHSAIRQAGR